VDNTYLDFAASTPVDHQVINAMIRYMEVDYGNPSSIHYYGQNAEAAVEDARRRILFQFNASNYDVIFTSGGTESDNLALRGIAFAEKKKRNANKILISGVEHHAVLSTTHKLRDDFGFDLEILPVNENGKLDLAAFSKHLDESVAVVSVIFANNEIGTVNPIQEIGKLCKKHSIPFHTDAVQAAAHFKIDVLTQNIDLLTIGAHKFYGPKGVGALLKRKDLAIDPQITGGMQENGMRAGTHNVPSIIGMAKALELVSAESPEYSTKYKTFTDQIIATVLEKIPGSYLTGDPIDRLPNHASFVFKGIRGNDLLIALDMAGFSVSSGSACKVGNPVASDVLLSIGISEELAIGSLRVTLGKTTTQTQIDRFLLVLPAVINNLRSNLMRKN
jgi:cysteine desulfurase